MATEDQQPNDGPYDEQPTSASAADALDYPLQNTTADTMYEV